MQQRNWLILMDCKIIDLRSVCIVSHDIASVEVYNYIGLIHKAADYGLENYAQFFGISAFRFCKLSARLLADYAQLCAAL